MLRYGLIGLFTLSSLALASMTTLNEESTPPNPAELREQASQLRKDGNYAEAYELLHTLVLSDFEGRPVGRALSYAFVCLRDLDRIDELDDLLEAAVKKHPNNPYVLRSAEDAYRLAPHHGTWIGGEFVRGERGDPAGGTYVDATEYDRVRRVQLLLQVIELREKFEDDAERAHTYLSLAGAIGMDRFREDEWRFQEKTDFSELPSLQPGASNRRGWSMGGAGAPVNAEGDPLLYKIPESFESAQNDGERWRWALHRTETLDADVGRNARWVFAEFLHSQFGVTTLRGWSGWSRMADRTDTGKPESPSPYAFDTLSDDETIAELATGVQRFEMPEEFNFITIYKSLLNNDRATATAEYSLETLVQIYEDRRQYPKAAERLRQLIKRFGPGHDNDRKKQLEQIVGNWVQFDKLEQQLAGKPATSTIRYRNGEQVTFTATKVKYEQLLNDAIVYLRSEPNEFDRDRIDLNSIGQRLVVEGQDKYLGEEVASWTTELDPPEDHSDRLKVIETPIKQAGVYLLAAEIEDGNTDYILIWLTDMAFASVDTNSGPLYFVTDAATGKPVPNASVKLFGYDIEFKRIRGKYEAQYRFKDFSQRTDANGLARFERIPTESDFHWLAIARTDEGRLAHLGFDWIRDRNSQRDELDRTKAYIITDRPVYRPDQTVKLKVWVRRVGYDLDEKAASLAGQPFTVRINNPRREKVFEKSLIADERGGIELEYELPEEATLGSYHVRIVQPNRVFGTASFRVEEYKKPEFEVTVDAPDEPVMLGEPIKATIKANYYFGSPVTNATVHYKVTRTATDAHWFPSAPWDWFYEPGYWWFSGVYDWYPGFSSWGCLPPSWPSYYNPPEIVAEYEVPIGEDGTVEITIDTAVAKELFGESDHEYKITAEVTDASRRTITGSGSVYAPREPFKVFAWVDHGFFQAGDTINAHFKAQTIDHDPVQGDSTITLYRVSYDEQGIPIEEQVEQWKTETGADGKLTQRFEAAESGQYRIGCVVTDDEGHKIEGGYLLTVMPKDLKTEEPADYRYNDLELIVEDREYRPGDTARLLVATAQPNSTVLIFIRPEGDVYPEPRVLRLDGKAEVVEIEIQKSDMPNFFVEAITIANGELHNAVRELHVPPEKRIVNVEIEPSEKEYKPGEEASIDVKLTDFNGEPITGEVVLTMYDRSLEYISGGGNVADIRKFFWKWQRHHRPNVRHTLDRLAHHQTKPGATPLQYVGAFGWLLPWDDLEQAGTASERLSLDRGEPFSFYIPMYSHFGVGINSNHMQGMGGGMAIGGMGGMGGGMGGFGAMPASEAAPDMFAPVVRTPIGRPGPPHQDSRAGELVEATIRSDFADSAVWKPGKIADENGLLTLRFKMPENLTDWKIRAWAMGTGTRVGEAKASVVTRKNLLLRMQAPRFFTETDEVVLSANIHNYLRSDKEAQVTLKLEGDSLKFLDDATRSVTVPADGEVRVDWRVKAVQPGEAIVTMEALTDEESDAMRKTFPVQVHGMLRTESYTGTIRPDENEQTIEFRIPEKRREKDSRIEVRFSPSLAAAMVDALPYLVSYPYGCTEQTLNRFLPTVITQNILKEMDLDLPAIRQKKTNLNAQELGDPEQRRKRRWSQLYNHDENPVWDEAEVQKMIAVGVNRLIVTQSQDGGWSWFPGGDSSAHMTALVVHGLKLAQRNGVVIPDALMQRGVQWLKQHQQEELVKLKNGEKDENDDLPSKESASNLDAFVFHVLVENGVHDKTMEDHLYRDRLKLSAYALAMFGLALEETGAPDRLDMVVRNLTQFLVIDNENQTAYLRLPNDDWWWRWYGSEIEANAYYLKLLCRTDPQSDVSPKLVKYLLNNRRNATYWNSTRDTAIVIEALAEYLEVSGELEPNLTVEVLYDGEVRHEIVINRKNLFSIDNTVTIEGNDIDAGEHSITFRKTGKGPLYWNIYVTNFTQEDFIAAAGLEIKVRRKFYKLTRKEDATASFRGSRGQAVSGAIETYDRTELENGATLQSGDLIEVELIIESKNDYEYLAFEDMKAAGFEPVEVRSGYSRNGLGAYMELRDERVAFFVERLPRGRHSIRYRLRAEIPGSFSALPAKGHAMYAPELRANSDEMKVNIGDAKRIKADRIKQ